MKLLTTSPFIGRDDYAFIAKAISETMINHCFGYIPYKSLYRVFSKETSITRLYNMEGEGGVTVINNF